MSRTIPSYVEEMIDGAVSRLDNLKNEHTVSFAFMTDTHNCTTLTERGLYALREIDRRAGVAFTCLGGDYLCNNARTSREKALSQLRELGDLLESYTQPPVMAVNGNHDCNMFGPEENAVLPDEMYDIVMRHHRARFVCDDQAEKGMYGYYDVPEAKLRAVFLNVFDLTYRIKDGRLVPCGQPVGAALDGRQLQWVAERALALPPEWGVVFFAHTTPLPAPFEGGCERVFGGDALWEIICACKRGTAYTAFARCGVLSYDVHCDYTAQGPRDVIGFFCGHHHCDFTWKTDGIPIIVCLSAANDNFETHVCGDGRLHLKTRGSGEESAFSVFTVDRAARRIYCVRCGAGPDFSITY